jgi:hypothetical protein
MRFRIYFLLVTGFFVTMNVLLWRSEIIGQNQTLTPVPIATVWEKILTAPDSSWLTIEQGGTKLGTCTWMPTVGEGHRARNPESDEPLPEGMVRKVANYTIDLDGSVAIAPDLRARFTMHLRFSTNQVLQEVVVSLRLRPDYLDLRWDVASQKLAVWKGEAGQRTQQIYPLSEPRHWGILFEGLGVPVPPGMLDAIGGAAEVAPSLLPALSLGWQAHNDWWPMGSSRVRVYRVETQWLRPEPVRIFISHMGEILRLELPYNLVVKNDALNEIKPTRTTRD